MNEYTAGKFFNDGLILLLPIIAVSRRAILWPVDYLTGLLLYDFVSLEKLSTLNFSFRAIVLFLGYRSQNCSGLDADVS